MLKIIGYLPVSKDGKILSTKVMPNKGLCAVQKNRIKRKEATTQQENVVKACYKTLLKLSQR